MNVVLRFIAAALVVAASAAAAQEHKAGAISVTNAWTRATPPGASIAGAFMTITTSGAADRLVKAESPAAARTELHTMSMEGGIMRMRPVGAIDIRADAATELKPGGLHVMLMGLKEPLKEGASVRLKLTFEKAGALEVSVPVAGMGAGGPDPGHRMH